MAKFRRLPLEVEAVQWDGQNLDELMRFTEGKFSRDEARGRGCGSVHDELHATWITVYPGQWVIRGTKGEFYPIAEDVLAEAYEPAPESDGGRAHQPPLVVIPLPADVSALSAVMLALADIWQQRHGRTLTTADMATEETPWGQALVIRAPSENVIEHVGDSGHTASNDPMIG